jgi:cyanophycinase
LFLPHPVFVINNPQQARSITALTNFIAERRHAMLDVFRGLRLLAIGGAADKCFSDFLNLAGGPHASIIVLGHASASPRQSGEAVKASLAALGATRVKVMTPRTAGGIDDDVDAIYMTGGDQSRLVRLLDRHLLSEQVRDACRRGVLVAGSSAGAAAMPPVMIADGMGDGQLRRDSLLLGKGLCLLPATVVDTHFAQRNRFNRLRAALATVPGTVGIGLDEDTGVYIENGIARVVGVGNAHVYSRDASSQSVKWEDVAADVLIQHYGVGQSFSLAGGSAQGQSRLLELAGPLGFGGC